LYTFYARGLRLRLFARLYVAVDSFGCYAVTVTVYTRLYGCCVYFVLRTLLHVYVRALRCYTRVGYVVGLPHGTVVPGWLVTLPVVAFVYVGLRLVGLVGCCWLRLPPVYVGLLFYVPGYVGYVVVVIRYGWFTRIYIYVYVVVYVVDLHLRYGCWLRWLLLLRLRLHVVWLRLCCVWLVTRLRCTFALYVAVALLLLRLFTLLVTFTLLRWLLLRCTFYTCPIGYVVGFGYVVRSFVVAFVYPLPRSGSYVTVGWLIWVTLCCGYLPRLRLLYVLHTYVYVVDIRLVGHVCPHVYVALRLRWLLR